MVKKYLFSAIRNYRLDASLLFSSSLLPLFFFHAARQSIFLFRGTMNIISIIFAIGFENKSGGFELRNGSFKGGISPKDVTLIIVSGGL